MRLRRIYWCSNAVRLAALRQARLRFKFITMSGREKPIIFWRVGRAVECGGLENRCRRKMTGGSNPPLSACFWLSQKLARPRRFALQNGGSARSNDYSKFWRG